MRNPAGVGALAGLFICIGKAFAQCSSISDCPTGNVLGFSIQAIIITLFVAVFLTLAIAFAETFLCAEIVSVIIAGGFGISLHSFDIRRRRCIVRYKISFANAKARKK